MENLGGADEGLVERFIVNPRQFFFEQLLERMGVEEADADEEVEGRPTVLTSACKFGASLGGTNSAWRVEYLEWLGRLEKAKLVEGVGDGNALLCSVAHLLPGLRYLDLTSCHNITDAAVQEVAQHCPQLQLLDLSNCRNITDAAVQEIRAQYPRLHVVYH